MITKDHAINEIKRVGKFVRIKDGTLILEDSNCHRFKVSKNKIEIYGPSVLEPTEVEINENEYNELKQHFGK